MTPKEKAEDLVDKFLNQPINFPYIDTEDGQCIGSGYMTYYSAKQCALIAVDELISEYQSISDTDSIIYIENEITYVIHKLVYWQEVKQEIEKLWH